MKTKKCTKCGQEKPLTEYNKRASSSDGLQYACKQCNKASLRNWYKENKEYKEERNKIWKQKNKERFKKYQTQWVKDNPERVKAYTDKYHTKIPPAVYQIRCLVNNRVYIGESIKPQKRQNEHWTRLKAGQHKNCYLQDDYNEYGRDAFVFEILEAPKAEALLDCEKYWIDRTSANNYNIRCV